MKKDYYVFSEKNQVPYILSYKTVEEVTLAMCMRSLGENENLNFHACDDVASHFLWILKMRKRGIEYSIKTQWV